MINLKLINVKNRQEVFERVWKSAEKDLVSLQDRLDKHKAYEELGKTSTSIGKYELKELRRDVETSQYWLNFHIAEMDDYKKLNSMYFI